MSARQPLGCRQNVSIFVGGVLLAIIMAEWRWAELALIAPDDPRLFELLRRRSGRD